MRAHVLKREFSKIKVLLFVSFEGYDPGGYGYYIMVDHPDGTRTLYAHCSGFCVEVGQHVTAGTVIAAVGSTGGSTGPHLHLEYHVNGGTVDPAPMLTAAGWDLSYSGTPMFINGEFAFSDAEDLPWDLGNFYKV